MRINIYLIILLLIILLIYSFIAPITAFFVAIFSDEKHSFQTLESLSTFVGTALTLVFSPITIYFLYQAFHQQKIANQQFVEDANKQQLKSNLEAYYNILQKKIDDFKFCDLDFDLSDLVYLDNHSNEFIDDDIWFKQRLEQYKEANKDEISTIFTGGEAISKMFNRIYCGSHWHDEHRLRTNEKFTDLCLMITIIFDAINLADKNDLKQNAYYNLILHLYKNKIHPGVSENNAHINPPENCANCNTEHGIPEKLRQMFLMIEIHTEHLIPYEHD